MGWGEPHGRSSRRCGVDVDARLNLMHDLLALARHPETTAAALDAIVELVPATKRHAGVHPDAEALSEFFAHEVRLLS